MHKGRAYPFLYEYWATNFLFWPWFPPDRLLAAPLGGTVGTGWQVWPTSPATISCGRGIWSDVTKRLFYPFVVPGANWVGSATLADQGGTPGLDGALILDILYNTGAFASAKGTFPFAGTLNQVITVTETVTGGGFVPAIALDVLVEPTPWGFP